MEDHDWKEEIALQFRDLKVDRSLIIETIKSTASVIENNFSRYDIKKKVTIDISSISLYYLDIENYRKIDVAIKEDLKSATFAVSNNRTQPNASLPLFIDKGIHIIEYVNSTKQSKYLYEIDGIVIDEIFGDLIMINNEFASQHNRR